MLFLISGRDLQGFLSDVGAASYLDAPLVLVVCVPPADMILRYRVARPRGRGALPCPAETLSVVWQTSGTIRSFNVAFTLVRSFALFA